MSERLDAGRVLRAAAPHALLGTVRDHLAAVYGATSVRLYLTDYGGTVLSPRDDSSGDEDAPLLPISGSAEGRALGSQERREQQVPRGEAIDHHLPVTVRGDRIGILTVRLPGDRSTPAVLDKLRQVVDQLGHEILVAERDTDIYQRVRRVSRLTLAAEMQWQLLPARALHATRLLPAALVPGAVLRDVAEYRAMETRDDALALCFDWFGGGHD